MHNLLCIYLGIFSAQQTYCRYPVHTFVQYCTYVAFKVQLPKKQIVRLLASSLPPESKMSLSQKMNLRDTLDGM